MELKPTKMGITSPVAGSKTPKKDATSDGNFYTNDSDLSKWSADASGLVNKFHSRSDVDRSARAQHHTLGFRPNQASPGNHIHDGTTARKLGTGLGLVLTGSKGGNVALTNLLTMLKNLIDFTDNTT